MKLFHSLAAFVALDVSSQALAQQISDCAASTSTAIITATVTETIFGVSSGMATTESTTITVFDVVTIHANASTTTFIGEATDASNNTASVQKNNSTSNLTLDSVTESFIQTKPHVVSVGVGQDGWNASTGNLNSPTSTTVRVGIFGRAAQVSTSTIGLFTEIRSGGSQLLIPPYPTTTTTSTTRTVAVGTGASSGTGTAGPQTDCGESGDFRLGFDDLPAFVTNTTDITQAVPIFSPYHHFQFSRGYVYAPLPETPFRAVTPPHLAVFITNTTGASNTPSAGLLRPGEIGAGQRASDQAFWFNAYAVYLGCDNRDSPGCLYEITGYTWDGSSKTEVPSYRDNITTPACPILKDCPLTFVDLPANMRGLSGFQIRAFAGQQQRIWFMDELALGWWDNSCEAGRIRARSR